MMGQRGGMQDKLFYSFNLDDHVPHGHLLRGIDRCLDLGNLREHLAPYYSHTGRPSIDPELMMRMLVIGYCMGVRSAFSKNRHGRFPRQRRVPPRVRDRAAPLHERRPGRRQRLRG
jgi:hypothetical protein